MGLGKGTALLLPVAAMFTFFLCCARVARAQVPIPSRLDGFVYGAAGAPAPAPRWNSVVVDAFFDPLCPDSKDAWPDLRRAVKHYSPRVSLSVHPFALPYHDNSFVACRALHIADKLNSSATYPLLELFFKYQDRYYNRATRELSRASIVGSIAKLAAKATGHNSTSAVESGFQDPSTDMAARISFKYGCSRGVMGTPSFFVNGFPLPDGGSAIDYHKWKSIIDPLVKDV